MQPDIQIWPVDFFTLENCEDEQPCSNLNSNCNFVKCTDTDAVTILMPKQSNQPSSSPLSTPISLSEINTASSKLLIAMQNMTKDNPNKDDPNKLWSEADSVEIGPGWNKITEQNDIVSQIGGQAGGGTTTSDCPICKIECPEAVDDMNMNICPAKLKKTVYNDLTKEECKKKGDDFDKMCEENEKGKCTHSCSRYYPELKLEWSKSPWLQQKSDAVPFSPISPQLFTKYNILTKYIFLIKNIFELICENLLSFRDQMVFNILEQVDPNDNFECCGGAGFESYCKRGGGEKTIYSKSVDTIKSWGDAAQKNVKKLFDKWTGSNPEEIDEENKIKIDKCNNLVPWMPPPFGPAEGKKRGTQDNPYCFWAKTDKGKCPPL